MRLAWLVVLVAACGRVDFDAQLAGDAGVSGDGDGGAVVGFVQQSTVTSIGNATTTEVTFPAAPGAGHLVVAATWCWDLTGGCTFGVNAVTGGDGAMYQQAETITSTLTECSGGQVSLALYYLALATPGSPTLTVAPTGTPNKLEIGLVAVEYAGFSELDAATKRETAGTPSPMVFDTSTLATTAPTELLVSVATACSGYPGSVAWTETQGFTLRAHEDMTTSVEPAYVADLLVGPGTHRDEWSVTYTVGNTYPSLAALAAFR